MSGDGKLNEHRTGRDCEKLMSTYQIFLPADECTRRAGTFLMPEQDICMESFDGEMRYSTENDSGSSLVYIELITNCPVLLGICIKF